MTEIPKVALCPDGNSSFEMRTLSSDGGNLLPTLGIRSFKNHIEIVVVDLTGKPSHMIIVRQNGDVEVDS